MSNKTITSKYPKQKKYWYKTPSGRWVFAHRPDPSAKMPVKELEPPHGPTEERLTIKELGGLEKYAEAIEAGRRFQKKLGGTD